MNMDECYDLCRLAALLGGQSTESSLVIARNIKRMVSISRSLFRVALKSCNEGLSEVDTKRWDKLEKEALEIATNWHMAIEFHTDPRGGARTIGLTGFGHTFRI